MTTPSVRISNEPEERGGEGERERKNAIYSGHLRLCQRPRAAQALRSDQQFLHRNCQLDLSVQIHFLEKFQKNCLGFDS